jgi:hypothetical protein
MENKINKKYKDILEINIIKINIIKIKIKNRLI